MKLYIDLQGAQTKGSRRRGIGRYTRDLVNALARRSQELTQVTLGWNHSLPNPLPDLDLTTLPQTTRPELVSSPYGSLKRAKYRNNTHDLQYDINNILFKQNVLESKCGHFLISSVMETDEKDFVLPNNLNFGTGITSYSIVYDIIPYLYKDLYLNESSTYYKYLSHLNCKLSADIIFAISERTRKDIISNFSIAPERIINIGAGIDTNLFAKNSTITPNFSDKFGITSDFIFYLGGDEFRKNLPNLLKSLKLLHSETLKSVQLLVSGTITDERKSELITLAYNEQIPKSAIIFAGHMSEEDLVQAYQSCAMTVIPSVYEGFGLPVLEAMACNSVVIASGNSSMSEILADKQFLFDPYSPRDIADKIEFVLRSPQAVARLKGTYKSILAMHTWDLVAGRIIHIINQKDGTKRLKFKSKNSVITPDAHLKFNVSSMADNAMNNEVIELSKNNEVTLFSDTRNLSSINHLPLRIDNSKNIENYEINKTPIFSLINEENDLIYVLKKLNTTENVLIFKQETLNNIKEKYINTYSTKINYRLSHFYGLYVIINNKLYCLDPKTLEKINPAPGRDFKNQIASICEEYSMLNAYNLADKLKQVLNRHGKIQQLAKTVSELSAISKFSRTTI